MKQLILITLIAVSCSLFSQRVYTDSIQVSAISGTDTTIFIPFKTENGSLMIFDFTNLSHNDGTLDFGYSNDGITFITPDVTGIPVTLSKVTYTKTCNGTAKSKFGFATNKWKTKYLAFKFTKGSNTSGALYYRFTR